MKSKNRGWQFFFGVGGFVTLLGLTLFLVTCFSRYCQAGLHKRGDCGPGLLVPGSCNPACGVAQYQFSGEPGGTWYWVRTPEEERRVIMGLFNRYCIRCHGVDGRGVWDIPNVPNFTNATWQACRSDSQLVRTILEGRGAVMPPFRGTLTLEEAWGMARYLRTFLPGTEKSQPDFGTTAPKPTPVPGK